MVVHAAEEERSLQGLGKSIIVEEDVLVSYTDTTYCQIIIINNNCRLAGHNVVVYSMLGNFPGKIPQLSFAITVTVTNVPVQASGYICRAP